MEPLVCDDRTSIVSTFDLKSHSENDPPCIVFKGRSKPRVNLIWRMTKTKIWDVFQNILCVTVLHIRHQVLQSRTSANEPAERLAEKNTGKPKFTSLVEPILLRSLKEVGYVELEQIINSSLRSDRNKARSSNNFVWWEWLHLRLTTTHRGLSAQIVFNCTTRLRTALGSLKGPRRVQILIESYLQW